MKFKIGDHLKEIGSYAHGIVTHLTDGKHRIYGKIGNDRNWYLIKNDELGLVNHWVPEDKLELHKQTLRENKLKELEI